MIMDEAMRKVVHMFKLIEKDYPCNVGLVAYYAVLYLKAIEKELREI